MVGDGFGAILTRGSRNDGIAVLLFGYSIQNIMLKGVQDRPKTANKTEKEPLLGALVVYGAELVSYSDTDVER